MGIDISSKLMLVPTDINMYDYLRTTYPDKSKDYHSLLDELGLDYASPYYDARYSDLVIGVSVCCPTYEDILDKESTWREELREAQVKLCKVFGGYINPRLQDCTNVW